MTSRPAPGAARVAANGIVGSSQCRCSPTSISRRPRAASSRRNSTARAGSPGSAARLGQRAQHACQADSGVERAAVERAADRLDAVARRGVELLRLLVEPGGEPLAQRGERLGDAGQRAGEPLGGLGDARARAGTGRIPARRRRRLAVAGGAGEHLAADQRAGTPRSGSAGRRPGRRVPGSLREAAGPAGRRQRAGGLQAPRPAASPARARRRPVPRCRRRRPRARDRPPSAPSSQRRSSAVSNAGQFGGERAVGRVEHVMALVEHVADRHRRCRPARPRPPASSPAHGWRRPARRCARGGSCARRSSAASAGRRRGCTRRAGRRGPGWWRCRTARRTSRAGRRPGCRRRRWPAPSARPGRAG